MDKRELDKLDKSELIDLIYDYWDYLKTRAIKDTMNKNDSYVETSGRINLTEVNRINNLLSLKIKEKNAY
jgi:hypothetical protein|tara:strand:+ start:118 stop:327 length:210 start_codon:yes stop_codon:yes gene_type:complete